MQTEWHADHEFDPAPRTIEGRHPHPLPHFHSSARSSRALIIDSRAVLATDVCRSLSRLKWSVDIVGQKGSPAFRSRRCRRRLAPPSFSTGECFLKMLRNTVEEGGYDAIFICSEAILELILPLIGVCPAWRALPLSAPDSVKVTLSKSASLRLAEKAGVVVPRTLVPTDQNQVEALGRELGFPLVVKGDKGEATQNVRFVWQPSELLARYMQVSAADSVYHGRPALQEFIPGPQYSLGGLFHDGEPLRICAYRKLFTYPIPGGLTAKAITERPRELLDSACAIFRALRYTGFGQVQFIRDSRDGRFKFLEINPRVWACIGLAQHAG